jgi:hypothetical protein
MPCPTLPSLAPTPWVVPFRALIGGTHSHQTDTAGVKRTETMDALRLATPADAEAIDALMKPSITAIFSTTYDARQTASAIIHVASVDRMLLADGRTS